MSDMPVLGAFCYSDSIIIGRLKSEMAALRARLAAAEAEAKLNRAKYEGAVNAIPVVVAKQTERLQAELATERAARKTAEARVEWSESRRAEALRGYETERARAESAEKEARDVALMSSAYLGALMAGRDAVTLTPDALRSARLVRIEHRPFNGARLIATDDTLGSELDRRAAPPRTTPPEAAPARCEATPNPGSTLRCDRPAGHDGNHSAWTRGEHGVYGHTNWEPAAPATPPEATATVPCTWLLGATCPLPRNVNVDCANDCPGATPEGGPRDAR